MNDLKRKVTFMSYGNHRFCLAKKELLASIKKYGEIDDVRIFEPWDIDADFKKKYKNILKYRRGDGYWLWKPYFVQKTLRTLKDNDILFFTDMGCHFISSINPLIKLFDNMDQPLISFDEEIFLLEKHWTKKDCFIKLGCNDSRYTDTPQRLSGLHLWRKCDTTMRLANEWLHYATDKHMLTDSPSIQPNYPQFVEHRHDQSIFSLLSKKYGFNTFRLISEAGNLHKKLYDNSPYNQIISLTRKRDLRRTLFVPKYARIMRLKCYIYYLINYGPFWFLKKSNSRSFLQQITGKK